MARTARSAGSPHRGWRAQIDTESANKSKKVARVLLSILGLVLTGILAWVLVEILLSPCTHLACLPVVDYNPGIVPPIPFCEENAEEFRLSRPGGREKVPRFQELETLESIPTMDNRLRAIVAGGGDTLILYVSAHGVSYDGKAYLLCSDFLRNPDVDAAFELGEFFKLISSCPGKLKLLILDMGYIASDPRLGMLVNEFPRLIEQESAKVDDPSIWVLSANSPLEDCRVSYGIDRSIFAYFVTEAVKGHADEKADENEKGNGNGVVDMAELFEFVRSGVADWVYQESDGAARQTPLLVHAGKKTNDPPRLEVIKISDRMLDKEPKPEEGTGNKDDPGDQGESTGGQGEDEQPEPEVKPEEEPPGAAARRAVRDLLGKAWAVRDRAHERNASDDWLPVDYAPHLWRKFQEVLLGYEQQYRSGTAFNADVLEANIRTKTLPLEDLINGRALPAGMGLKTVLSPMSKARERFMQDAPSAAGNSEENTAIVEAIQLKNDLCSRVPYYVRWHALASRHSVRTHRLFGPISNLQEELREFIDRLDRLEEAGYGEPDRERMITILDDLNARKPMLLSLQESIEKDGMEKDALDVIANPAKLNNASRIEVLLSTPCLSAETRMRLLDALDNLDQPSPDDEGPSVDPETNSGQPWKRLREQAQLEQRLVQLANPVSSLDDPVQAPDSGEPENLWRDFRTIGKQLRQFYEELPPKVNDRCRSADQAVVREAERLLRLVDARDAERVLHDKVVAIAVRSIRIPPSPGEALALHGPDTMLIGAKTPAPLEVGVRGSGLESNDARVTLHYDPAKVIVKSLDGMSTATGQPASLLLDQGRATLRYQLFAASDDLKEDSVRLTVECGKHTESHQIVVALRPPDRVDLLVRRVSTERDFPIDGVDRFRLRPFPNRITEYRLDLVNHSGEKKKVTAQLVTVRNLRPLKPLSRELIVDESGEIRASVELLTPPVEMQLPADDKPMAIPFPAPEAPEEAAVAGGEDEPPPPKLVIPRRLACVIRDVATGEAKPIKWIDIAPRPPRNYVDCDVAYSARLRKILIELRFIDPEILPPSLEDEPVRVEWVTEGELDPNTPMKDEGKLVAADATAQLDAKVEPAFDRKVIVRLTVDGYPRAFVYHVPCDRDREHIRRERSLSEIRITAPEDNHAYRIPMEENIEVELQVDAPENAFQEAGDLIEMGIDADRDRELRGEEVRSLFDDRQVKIFLEEVGPRGLLKIGTEVSDFQLALDPSGLKNRRVDIMARLLLATRAPGQDRLAASDSVNVMLDGAPPDFELIASTWKVVQGEKFNVSAKVSADELSGVKQMLFGFDRDKSGKLEEDEEKPLKILQAGEDGLWHAAVPTKGLELGRQQLRVIATDRAGNDPTDKMEYVTVVKPPEVERLPGGEPKPKNSTLIGTVTREDGEPVRRAEVSLEGANKTAETKTDSNGRFTVEEIPPGEYTIHIKGSVRNKTTETSRKITLHAEEEPARKDFTLDW